MRRPAVGRPRACARGDERVARGQSSPTAAAQRAVGRPSGVILDLDADGRVLAIEILNVSRQVKLPSSVTREVAAK